MKNLPDLNDILRIIPENGQPLSYTALTRAFDSYYDTFQEIYLKYRLPYFVQSLEEISINIDMMNDASKPEPLKTRLYHKVRQALITDVNALLNMPSSI